MIARWLTRYQDQHQFINVSFVQDAKDSETFATGILYIDLKSKNFFIEELRPKIATKHLKPGIKLYFSLTVDGVKHQFQARYIKTNDLLQGTSHQCEFPRAIEQIQLRNAFRVKVPRGTPVKVSLTHPTKNFLSGQAADLSATGVRLRINGSLHYQPTRGDTYPVCRLLLPTGTEIFCQGQLMHWRHVPEHKTTYLGIKFLRMEGQHERALGRFLADLQRREKELVRI